MIKTLPFRLRINEYLGMSEAEIAMEALAGDWFAMTLLKPDVAKFYHDLWKLEPTNFVWEDE